MLAADFPALAYNSPRAAMGITQENSFASLEADDNSVYLTFPADEYRRRNDSGDDNCADSNLSAVPPSSSGESGGVQSPVSCSKSETVSEDREGQRVNSAIDFPTATETQVPAVRPKYGKRLVGLPEKLMSRVKQLDLDEDVDVKKVKKKKWKVVNVEDMGFRLSLFPRVPVVTDEKDVEKEQEYFEALVELEMDITESQTQPFGHLQNLEGSRLTREERFVRKDRDHKEQKAHRQVKGKHVTPKGVTNNKGRKTLYIHFRLYKNLPFLDCLSREHPNYPSPPRRPGVCLDVAKAAGKAQAKLANRASSGRTGGRNSAPVQNLSHALDHANAAKDLPTDIIAFLVSLQHREMTPEDYDMLLRLDDGVAPKTVDDDVIGALKTDVVDECSAGSTCSVCMEAYEVGQHRKFLPCQHVFHSQCIDMWLSNSSQNCPLDGLPVGVS